MLKRIINENERGFLFKNGKYIKMLEAGKYCEMPGRKIEVVEMNQPVMSGICSLETLMKDKNFIRQTTVVEVEDEQIALHFINGKFSGALKAGKYAFWSVSDKHQFTMVSIAEPEVSSDIPQYIFSKLPSFFFTKVEVAEYEKARLYYNNKMVKILDAGTYYFWKGKTAVAVNKVDTRLTQMNIAGQELLTKDKANIRINFVCNYKITDYVKVLTEIDDFKEQLHVAVQLALREYVGKYRLDEILEEREQIGKYVLAKLKEKAKELYVEITGTGVKDIILPGEIRDIMNIVLVAEKRAQANVITRREEVASTRSLLNTAKLMDENKTLYKLKELEYMERICENVGNITVNGNTDLLTQLTTIMRGKDK